MKYLIKIVLLVVFGIIAVFGNKAMAQDTESKDQMTIITIHVKMKTIGVNSLYTDREDTLRKTLEAIDGVKNVKIQLTKQLVSFEIPSHKLISERKLRKIVSKVGFYPSTIEFLKENDDEEERNNVPSVL